MFKHVNSLVTLQQVFKYSVDIDFYSTPEKLVDVSPCLPTLFRIFRNNFTSNATGDVTGIDNMIKNDIYTAAYPLHDVSIAIFIP